MHTSPLSEVSFVSRVARAGYSWEHRSSEWWLKESPSQNEKGFQSRNTDEDSPALFLELSGIEPGDRDAIKRFADQHGQIEPGDTNRATGWATWSRTITELRRAVEVYGLLLRGDVESFDNDVRALPLNNGPARWQVRASDGWADVSRPEFTPHSDPRDIADAWLDDVLADRLNAPHFYCTRFVRDDRTKGRSIGIFPTHLRALLWLQFARAVITGLDLARDYGKCPRKDCPRWFYMTPKERGRRLFCTDACKMAHYRDRRSGG